MFKILKWLLILALPCGIIFFLFRKPILAFIQKLKTKVQPMAQNVKAKILEVTKPETETIKEDAETEISD